MSPNIARFFKILLVLSLIAWLVSLLPSLKSTFVLVDPPQDQKRLTPPYDEIIKQDVLTPPFDIIVKHEGCGTVDANTFQAYLESEKGEKVSVHFSYDTSYTEGQRWILKDYDPSADFKQGSYGRYFLHVTADESFFCLVYLPVFTFKVGEFIGPSFFIDKDGQQLGSVTFPAVLHSGNNNDEDLFTIKAPDGPNTAFGQWFKITVTSENPSYDLALRLLSPKDKDNLIEIKSNKPAVWVGLKNGVSTKFRVSGAYGFPEKTNLVRYQVDIEQSSIPDANEPNDDIANAKEISKGVTSLNYMAGVLDADDNVIGVDDYFKIKHRDCVVDCLEFQNKTDSRPYKVTFCREDPRYPNVCGGGGEYEVTDRYCAYKTGAEDCLGSINCDASHYCPDCSRYWRVSVDCKTNCAYGDVSNSKYGDTYQVKWSEECRYPGTDDFTCVTSAGCMPITDSAK